MKRALCRQKLDDIVNSIRDQGGPIATPIGEEYTLSYPLIPEESLISEESLIPEESIKTNKECVICLDSVPRYAAIPCGHLLTCENCYTNFKKCPYCRKPVTETLRLFV
jgi:hypothetical protein